MRPKTDITLASIFIMTLGLVDAKSMGDLHAKIKKSGESENTEAMAGILSRLAAHKKSAAFIESGSSPEWIGDLNGFGTGSEFAFPEQFSKRAPMIDNVVLDPETTLEKQEALKKMEVISLMEAAIKQGLPWDYYLSTMAKRSGTDLQADLSQLGYDDIMNQPRLLDRETRDDGRRYLMWRKITG